MIKQKLIVMVELACGCELSLAMLGLGEQPVVGAMMKCPIFPITHSDVTVMQVYGVPADYVGKTNDSRSFHVALGFEAPSYKDAMLAVDEIDDLLLRKGLDLATYRIEEVPDSDS